MCVCVCVCGVWVWVGVCGWGVRSNEEFFEDRLDLGMIGVALLTCYRCSWDGKTTLFKNVLRAAICNLKQ